MTLTALGLTEEVTTCECCGKKNLKVTVALQHEDGGIVYYGRDCAGKAIYGRKNRHNTQAVESNAIKYDELKPVIDAIKQENNPFAAEEAGRKVAKSKTWIFRGVKESIPNVKYWRTSDTIRVSWIGLDIAIPGSYFNSSNQEEDR